ncbi:MAG: hypothetical protein LBD14_07035, partial [Puniceicoccales bacterium]|nr:hypothetical protein [Puniceicoccales bacterium]
MPIHANNATSTAAALGFGKVASGYGVRECVSARDFAGLRPVPPAAGGSANNAPCYGVRDFSPALGAGNLFPASLDWNNAPDGQTAINRLRESGDVPSETGRINPAAGGIARSATMTARAPRPAVGGTFRIAKSVSRRGHTTPPPPPPNNNNFVNNWDGISSAVDGGDLADGSASRLCRFR